MEKGRLNPSIADFSGVPLAAMVRINQLADQFEAELAAGAEPSVDSYVEQLDADNEPARTALKHHLEAVTSEFKQSARLLNPTPGQQDFSTEREHVEGMAAPLQILDPNTNIGEYRILRHLSTGGMGVVYQAQHTKLDCLVAIKFPRLGDYIDSQAASRFLREARLVGRLQHSHIVRALDASDSHYGPYLVTEFIDGETLDAFVRREGPLPVQQSLGLIRQAAQALGYAHQKGVIHRDIKPSNLIIDSHGKLRIVDFGLGKLREDVTKQPPGAQDDEKTQAGTFIGTVEYAAPEQLFAESSVDHRADIYSLGCVLYFMLSGEAPHTGTLSDRIIASQGLGQPLPELTRDDLPASLVTAWQQMVAASPEQRFGNMSDIEAAFESDAEQLSAPPAELPNRHVARILTSSALLLTILTLGWTTTHNRKVEPANDAPPRAVVPFSGARAQQMQQAWADFLHVPVRVENSLGMRMVLIPAGEFEMGFDEPPEPGVPEGDWRYVAAEHRARFYLPKHRVVLTSPYYLGETEVTYGQFKRFVDATGYLTDAEGTSGWGKEDAGWIYREGYSWKNSGQWVHQESFPVMNVSWNDATAFCRWLSETDDLGSYRLPSEAEWEFACRAGTTTTYYFGDDPSEMPNHAWCKANFDAALQPVRSKHPNPFGLFDLYGSRQEWCLDVLDENFYSQSPLSDPVCRSGGDQRVLRGGCHTDFATFSTSARRWSQEASGVSASGFRVVCVPK